MRKAWLPPALIVVGILVQLTVLNGLRLPGGGVPDLVLILVAALAVAEGPLAGLIVGFAAGLCLDLAPPGSALIGQYALVFCLAGWAAGRLSGATGRTPLRSAVLMAIVVAAAEVASAGLGLALQPAQVTLAEVRAVLPATIGYDLLLCPFVLYLVVLASSLLADGLAGGALGGTLAASDRARRTEARKPRPRQPRLREAAARTGDGWLGGGARGYHGTRPPARPGARLRAANGVPGSASGLARHPGRAASAPVNLRMAAGRRGDGAIGNRVGTGSAAGGMRPHRQPGRHPGVLAGGSRFRPRQGEPGGSATRRHGAARAPGGHAAIRFGAHRGDATVGRTLGSGWQAAPGRPVSSGPRLRMGVRRSAVTGGHAATVVPRLRFRSGAPAVARRPAAVPRFRRTSSRLRPRATASGLVSGGVLDASTFRAARRRSGTPRLRLASRGRVAGMLGGSGGSALRRPARRMRKQPRFGYGKRSPLSFPAVTRFGGRWLARRRAGSRSGTWLIGKRTGGLR